HFVHYVRIVYEHLVSVGKSGRDINRSPFVVVKHNGDVVKIGRTFWSQIDDDVKECAAGAAHKLRLDGWRKLEMHATQRPCSRIRRDARLSDQRIEAEVPKLTLAKNAGKKAALVGPPLKVDNERAFQFGLGKDHALSQAVGTLKRLRHLRA